MYELGLLTAEAADNDAHVLLSASPHKWGAGKTHIVCDLETRCGRKLEATPGTLSVGLLDSVDCLLCIRSVEARQRQAEREAQWQDRQREWNDRRREEDERWRTRYESYLQTGAWRERRKRVMERTRGLCEGCGQRRATQVHHLTYERVGAEMLFDLVAICDDCHARIHRR